MQEEFSKNLSFEEGRHSVKLSWKESYPKLPRKNSMTLRWWKTQIARLEKEPEVLRGYTVTINKQRETSVIERVVELEKAEKVHYLPHQAVIWKRPQPQR